jgi:hypothetical protein
VNREQHKRPVLIAFPVYHQGRLTDVVKAWCPYCAKWHIHGQGDAHVRGRSHRLAHCGAGPFCEGGYELQLVAEKDIETFFPVSR